MSFGQAFEHHQEANLLDLCQELRDRTYRPSRSVCFFAERPKLREIFAAPFRDRIVHHVLVAALERVWEPVFIHDSYACRRGKGIHRAARRLAQFIRQVTANGTRPAWYLQLDIQNYFMRIDRAILYDLLLPRLPTDNLRWLAATLIFHDCTADPEMRADPRLVDLLPPEKTLFHAPAGIGLPIGNLTSQFFANVYLNLLDQFVKHSLRCRFYLRYCDDFVLLAGSRDQLLAWRAAIAEFLASALALNLNPRRQRLGQANGGIDFVGYLVRADYSLVRRRVVGNLTARLRAAERHLVRILPDATRFSFDLPALDRLVATIASFLGHARHANSHRLVAALWERHAFLGRYFLLTPDLHRLVPRFRPPAGMGRVASQYRFFRWRFPEAVVFLQVGSFIEFFSARDEALASGLGLSPMAANRRGARYGFPFAQLPRRRAAVLAAGRPVLFVAEAVPWHASPVPPIGVPLLAPGAQAAALGAGPGPARWERDAATGPASTTAIRSGIFPPVAAACTAIKPRLPLWLDEPRLAA
ncbi:MAG: reverse transcriptase/maturase family protein [Thermodesulfobacteriota bacterium]